MQRRIERTVRKLQRRKAAFKAAGSKDAEQAVNIRIRRLKAKYKEFSRVAGLREQPQRMKVKFQEFGKLRQKEGYVSVPSEYDGNFDDFRPLNLSRAEEKALLTVRELSHKNGFEYGTIVSGENIDDPFTSNDINGVQININDCVPGCHIVHSHTNDTPLSSKDFSFLLNKNVESISNVAYNGDVFRAYVGDGWIPDRSEFDLAVRTISRDADIEIMNDPSFMSWSEPERTYMAIREQAYRIARYFEWTLEGGRIE